MIVARDTSAFALAAALGASGLCCHAAVPDPRAGPRLTVAIITLRVNVCILTSSMGRHYSGDNIFALKD